MRDTFACIDIPERLPHERLDHEVDERQDDLHDQHGGEEQNPTALPGKPRQRAEQHGIEEIASRMQFQFGGALRAACGQARTPLVIVERVERTDDAQNRQQPERHDHGCVSVTSMMPAYEINSPMTGSTTRTST